MNPPPDYPSLHRQFGEITGMPVRFVWQSHEGAWFQWLSAGFTMDDLRVVAAYLKKGIAQRFRYPACLRFDRLIEDPGKFASLLSEAESDLHKWPRRPKPEAGQAARDSILRATGRESGTAKERTAEQILAETEALERLRRWRENL